MSIAVNYAGAVANNNVFGSTAWTNPAAAQGNQALGAATVDTTSTATNSQYLQATSFGFAVPANATITGIRVGFYRNTTVVNGGVTDKHVYLVKGGTVQTTQDRASAVAWAGGGSTYWAYYGCSTDLWGLSLAPADVNASNFGVVLSVNGNDTASVYAVSIAVYYTLPKELITIDYARDFLGGQQGNINLTLSDNELVTLGALITACSDAIEKYCRRRFRSTFFDELYNGNGQRRLLLRQYPIQSVQSVRYRPVTVLKIGNSDPSNVQARVSVTSTGLKLYRFQNGASSTDTSVTFAGNPTLAQVVTAVNALGHGWNAQVVGDSNNYGAWPSADLFWPNSCGDPLEGAGIQESQGAASTVVGSGAGSFAELKMHTYELQGYQWDPRGWLLRAIPYTDPELLHPEDLIFPVGTNNFRIQYTAGYTTVPEAVQQACALWAAELFWVTKRDPGLLTQVPQSSTTQSWSLATPPQPPVMVQTLLAPCRRHAVSVDQG